MSSRWTETVLTPITEHFHTGTLVSLLLKVCVSVKLMMCSTGSEWEFLKEAEWLPGKPSETWITLCTASQAHLLHQGNQGHCDRCWSGNAQLRWSFYTQKSLLVLISTTAPLNPPSWSAGFRTVSFTLQTKDVLSTVTNILKCCSLPVEHVSSLKRSTEKSSRTPEAAVPFYRPIKWDKSYYSFTGFRDPEEDLQRARRTEPTLRSSMGLLKDMSGIS